MRPGDELSTKGQVGAEMHSGELVRDDEVPTHAYSAGAIRLLYWEATPGTQGVGLASPPGDVAGT